MADKPSFRTGWLEDLDDIDLKKHVWAYKVTREIWRRMSIFRGELKGNHPDFAPDSKAAVVELADGPIVHDNDSRIEYSAEDDKAIEQKIREIVSTTWHSLGTCKMAPRDKKGVLDSSLSVYGVKGLKIADLSVPPGNVGANTGGYVMSLSFTNAVDEADADADDSTCFLIGEKAADIFINELGIEKKTSTENPQARL